MYNENVRKAGSFDGQYYKTTDLPLGAFLLYHQVKLDLIEEEQTHSGRKIMWFEESHKYEIEAIVETYLSGKAIVEPRRYANEIRNLKSRISGRI